MITPTANSATHDPAPAPRQRAVQRVAGAHVTATRRTAPSPGRRSRSRPAGCAPRTTAPASAVPRADTADGPGRGPRRAGHAVAATRDRPLPGRPSPPTRRRPSELEESRDGPRSARSRLHRHRRLARDRARGRPPAARRGRPRCCSSGRGEEALRAAAEQCGGDARVWLALDVTDPDAGERAVGRLPGALRPARRAGQQRRHELRCARSTSSPTRTGRRSGRST